MDKYEAVLKLLVEAIQNNQGKEVIEPKAFEIPVGVSNRHAHLSQEDLDMLFGKGYKLTKIKDLSQPGQYACKERVTITGPKGSIKNVVVLGPCRNETQVEISLTDGSTLGLKAPIKQSGDLEGTLSIKISTQYGEVELDKGLMVAKRHIHMTPCDARELGVHDGEIVSIKFDTIRGGIFNNVAIRANDASKLECHLDIEEVNAMGINSKSKVEIVKH